MAEALPTWSLRPWSLPRAGGRWKCSEGTRCSLYLSLYQASSAASSCHVDGREIHFAPLSMDEPLVEIPWFLKVCAGKSS